MEKKLRQGYTTGSCATAATVGALTFLLGGSPMSVLKLKTPKGKVVSIPLLDYRKEGDWASCAARKDSGDDPDVTNGTLIVSKVRLRPDSPGQILVDGGSGVGRVTKPGLARKVGEAAINPVPLAMITAGAGQVAEEFSYEGGLDIEISVPEGEELAKKTFNSKLGILGGISILGTTGIVEPMSEKALVDTIKVEIDVLAASGEETLVITPGNYGEKYLSENTHISPEKIVKCSNFIGETLDYAAKKEFGAVLLVGHVGKLIKVAAGAMNTHSKYGDGRMETLEKYGRESGGKEEAMERLSRCVTTEDGISLLKEEGLWDKVVTKIMTDIHGNCMKRVDARTRVGALMYSNVYGYLGETEDAEEILGRLGRMEK
ncbi:MAG: cobalt-precorrin-5B (C(1))-methyltransferase CbiD [Anaerovoracaceae bacterium]|jgi:cobalt-precorrin-5B (C1)-methyltransferase